MSERGTETFIVRCTRTELEYILACAEMRLEERKNARMNGKNNGVLRRGIRALEEALNETQQDTAAP